MENPLRPVIDRFAAALLAAVHDAIEQALRAPLSTTPPGRPPAGQAAKAPPPRRRSKPARPPSDQKETAARQRAQIHALVSVEGGMGFNALMEATKLSRRRVDYGLRVLRKEGKVVLRGHSRYARWSATGR